MINLFENGEVYQIFTGEGGGFRVQVFRPLPIEPRTPIIAGAETRRATEKGECGTVARRRYQKGRLFVRGKKVRKGKKVRECVWVGRWREDVIENGKLRRVYRSEVLGTLAELPTEKMAQRALDARLATVNDPHYRARPTAMFGEFSVRWEATVLTQYQPSTRSAIRSHLRRYLLSFFDDYRLKDIGAEVVQRFVSSVKASPKTVRNLVITLRMMWRSARAWGYVLHDPLASLVLPKVRKTDRFFFSVEELLRILTVAQEPYKTFFWLAAETGLRAGELCGVRVDDLDFDRRLVYVRQSAWHGKLQAPKTENATRVFELSPELVDHLLLFLREWRPNGNRLLFATRNGTPWDANLVVKRKLHPLLAKLGIQRCGLHAFRHTNETLMDRFGTPLKVRQQRLGHSDPRLTLGIYTHVASEDDRRIAEQLGKLLGGTFASAGILHPDAPKMEKGGIALVEQARLLQ